MSPIIEPSPDPGRSRAQHGTVPEVAGAAAVAGVLAVAVALLGGALVASVLVWLGLTETSWWSLTTWFAGTGLLGGWQQTVTATVAGGITWSTWVAASPMLVTLAVMLVVSIAARHQPVPARESAGIAGAAFGAAVAAMPLVVLSSRGDDTTNAAGTVAVTEGLTWWWTGGTRPGTVVGAALLVGGTWAVNTLARSWWRAGRAVAYGLLLLPGIVVTLAAAVAITYLSSSPALGFATVILFPLFGTTAILALGGAPATIGITRLSPQPYEFSTWAQGWWLGLAGLALVVVLAVIVGLVLRARRHESGWVAGITVPMAVAAFVCWASGSSVVVPESLGGPTEISVNWVAAAAVAALMASVSLIVRGRRTRPAPVETSAAEPDTGDLSASGR